MIGGVLEVAVGKDSAIMCAHNGTSPIMGIGRIGIFRVARAEAIRSSINEGYPDGFEGDFTADKARQEHGRQDIGQGLDEWYRNLVDQREGKALHADGGINVTRSMFWTGGLMSF